ncbi:MAG: bifunctional (p)ppGpp synthetase/guanosine-3',5'-bis(diphosphate) 3'-pyrophosphohydrolase [Acidimicrobiales bacterium]
MGLGARVLPWRRHEAPADQELAPLLETYRSHGGRDTTLVELAYQWARDSHVGQIRKSGEPYIEHPLAVARIVASLGLDDITVASALLHDVVEDCSCTMEELVENFGSEVAMIVDGVTKLDRVQFDSKEAQQAASMRKMLVAIAKDLRVIIIKLADRLHNMRTIGALPPEKQERIARETIEVYAPLAHRLGMQDMKGQLEDLAFAALHPKWYAQIEHMVGRRSPERELYLHQVVDTVLGRLVEVGIDAEVTGRPKHLWSIYEKMVVRGREFDDIYDLVGIRVIVENVRDCYAALGSLHASWKPVQGRFKDYIAMPKFNLYQSLHTTVVGPGGKSLEVQIRTREMHARAEHGVAAHWEYKDRDASGDLAWLGRMVDWTAETSDPAEFMATLKVDLEQDEVFVFTPKGEVITLPAGSTPVDFAYAVHTEVGHACVGARVGGKLVPLSTALSSGDSVEIFTSRSESAGPSRDWLRFAVTPKARNSIRRWFTRELREDARSAGRDEVVAELRREGVALADLRRSTILEDVAESMNYTDVASLYTAVGEGHVSARVVATRVAKAFLPDEPEPEHLPSTVQRPRASTGDVSKGDRSGVGVHVEGLDDMWVRLSKCCTPVPPDSIMGFVTRGRGVSVHRADCANAVSLAAGQADRLIDVEWDDIGPGSFVTTIEVKALDRARLLRDVATAMSDQEVNILAADTRTGSDRVSVMRFDFEVGDAAQVAAILSHLRSIDSVYSAHRVLPGSA